MSELGEDRSHNHLLEQVHSSCRIYSSHISELSRQVYIHCWAWCHRHRNVVRAGDGAFAVGVVELLGSVKTVDRNTYRDGDCSSCLEMLRVMFVLYRVEAVGDVGLWELLGRKL